MSKTNSGRRVINSSFAEHPCTAGDQVLARLDLIASEVLAVDPDGELEVAIIRAHCDSRSDWRLMAAVKPHFPSASKRVDILQCFHAVGALKESVGYKLAGRGLQAKLDTVTQSLGRMVDGNAPLIDRLLADKLLVGLVPCFHFFIRHSSAASSSEISRELYGVQALEAKIAIALSLGDARTRSDLQELNMFKWLAKKDDAIKIDRWWAACSSEAPTSTKRKHATPTTTDAPKKKRKEKTDSALASAMAMFTA